jgi:transcriptional regulator with XRE-family HTH domain
MGQIRNQALLDKVAKKIKAIRENHGITQEDFYNDTNIHIGRIETGNANLSISSLEAICKYFKISLADFFKDLKH